MIASDYAEESGDAGPLRVRVCSEANERDNDVSACGEVESAYYDVVNASVDAVNTSVDAVNTSHDAVSSMRD